MKNAYRFQVGQTVWVRGLEEILNTLDSEGKLNGLPFMPEMVPYCGRPYRVSSLPNRTCVEGFGLRELNGIVFLGNLRCSGSAHNGCQRECLLFWNEDWLSNEPPAQMLQNPADTLAATKIKFKTARGDRYFCQSTELAGASHELPDPHQGLCRKIRQGLRDVRHGNISLMEFLGHAFRRGTKKLKYLAGLDSGNSVFGNRQKTESTSLDLQPGDWVEVKSREEIAETLDGNGRNRGLLFDPPMLEYCGKRYRVAGRLQKMILEDSGRMIELQNTVVLDSVTCQAWGCPRANLHFWREIWLKRVDAAEQVRVG